MKARLTDIFSLSIIYGWSTATAGTRGRASTKEKNNGGNSDGDPPLPIPNREVKPVSADGTAIPSGRVGSRQPSETFRRNSGGLFFMPIDYQRFVYKDVVSLGLFFIIFAKI